MGNRMAEARAWGLAVLVLAALAALLYLAYAYTPCEWFLTTRDLPVRCLNPAVLR